MNKMTPKSLVAAIVVLTQQGKHVTMIQFEDGSGYKFNYTDGSGDPQFIDMKSDNMTEMVFEAIRDQKEKSEMTTEEIELEILKLKLKLRQSRVMAEAIAKDEEFLNGPWNEEEWNKKD